MTVEDRRGKPLPEGHPFKGTVIVFGQRRPVATSVEQRGAPTRDKGAAKEQGEADGERNECGGPTEPRADDTKTEER
jgi:hypothetical protein